MFLSITNDGDTADRLVAVTTGISPEVQLHETVTDGDRTSMQELPSGIDVPAGTTTVLEPGGLHAMFMKVEPLTADEQVPVTLSFDKAGDVTEVEVPVIPSPSWAAPWATATWTPTAPTTAAWTTAESALPEPPRPSGTHLTVTPFPSRRTGRPPARLAWRHEPPEIAPRFASPRIRRAATSRHPWRIAG